MKICFISNAQVIHLQRWAKAMIAYNHHVYVLSPYNARITDEINIITLPFYPLGTKGIKRIFSGIKNLQRIRKQISNIQPDIIHVMGIFELMAPDLKHILDGFRNIIISVWGTDIIWTKKINEPSKNKRIKKYILKKANIITATSNFLLNETKKYVDHKNMFVIHYGVDTDLFKPKEIPKSKQKIIIGYVKGLEEKYGIEWFIETIDLLKNEFINFEVWIIGDGSLRNKIKTIIDEKKLERYIKLMGKIEHNKLPEIMSQMDIFVMPSLYEGYGVVALEASACEIPVIATNIGGIPEVVLHNQTGILVEPLNYNAFKEALISLINNPEKRETLGKNGRNRAMQKVNQWNYNVKQMLQLYKKLLS